MSTQDLIMQLLLGGILGMLGQGIRVIVGLKKQTDSSASQGKTLTDSFNASQMVVSLFIGFVAGAIGIMSLVGFGHTSEIKQETAFSLLGIGYAGADFIEGFMSKYLPAGSVATTGPHAVVDVSASSKPGDDQNHPAMG